MPNMDFTKEYLVRLIADGIEESSQLEYKAAEALGRADGRKCELTKDISALANSAGGVLIYGIREHTDSDRSHLPERLDPVDQSEYSKEWLDQITASIQPRIEGLRIIPLHVGPKLSDYCYVIEIPQSATAHQALDRRYYRRRNFETTAMEDYEIRDVMNRRRHPVLTAEVRVVSRWPGDGSHIAVRVQNTTRVMARHFAVVVHMPLRLSSGMIRPEDARIESKDGLFLWLFSLGNGIGAPLFPDSMTILHNKFDHVQQTDPEPGASISDIRLSLYADEMEKIELSKDLSSAEREWT
jgi:Putative DNA-binding domain